jgi:putative addiction module component (TIGR02574 family)
MSFAEVLQELPALSVEQRQQLIRRALECDEPPLAPEDEALIEERLAAHRRDPGSAVPLEAMKSRLRSRFSR